MSDQPRPITKAVIAAAGFGTRFLPQTKAMPKEMLPLIDKPIIQYVVEELVAVGVQDIIIVTGYSKRAIEDHFDRPNEDLMNNLRQGGEKKAHLLNEVEAIANLANFVYVRQKGVYGTATPLLNTRHLLGNEPFFYTFSDDFISASPLRFSQMLEAYNKYKAPILSTIKVTEDRDYDRYGFAAGNLLDDHYVDVTEIIEKPSREHAPSDQATVCGMIATPELMEYVLKSKELLEPGSEHHYNDSLKLMLREGKQIIACPIQNGTYHDTGDKLDYLKTVFCFALKQPDISKELREYLIKQLKEYNEA
ncbi:MAG: UTP--glucose-1-phosphate uridylyltransferase [Candidatus Saccharimonadales bacterium]